MRFIERKYKKNLKDFSSSLLDSSLITSTDCSYNFKIIECGDYYYTYDFHYIKFKKLQDNSQVIKDINDTIYIEDTGEIIKFINTDYLHKKENTSKQKNIIEYKNILRSKFQLQRLIKSNEKDFYTFITLTFAKNISNISFTNEKFRQWTNSIRRIFPDFKYICVPEFQKRGAVHYHLLTNLNIDTDIIPKRKPLRLWNKIIKKYKTIEYYDIKYWKHGFSSAFSMSGINVIGYLSKYMTKDIDNRLFGRRRYLYSQNLFQPKEYFLNLKNKSDLLMFEKLQSNTTVKFKNFYYNTYDNFIVDFTEYKKIENSNEI